MFFTYIILFGCVAYMCHLLVINVSYILYYKEC